MIYVVAALLVLNMLLVFWIGTVLHNGISAIIQELMR